MKKAVPAAAAASLIAVCVISLNFVANPLAWAGPVERELIAKGDDVGFPKARPSSGNTNTTRDSSLPNPLDLPLRDDARAIVETERANTVASSEPTPPAPAETEVAATKSTCLQALLQIADAKRVASPPTEDAACVIEDPVVLIQTNSLFPVQFTKNLTLDCPFALALARFSDGTAQALGRHHLGSAISKIHSGEGFVCRRRNNALTGKLSEHAFGNATDWVGFTFADGSKLAIKDTAGMDADEAGFLDNLRSAACGTFTTILGPGANAAHASHFHFDLGRSKERKNPYRICE